MLFYTKNLIRTTFPVRFEIVAKMCIRINFAFAYGFNAEQKNIYLQLEKWHKHILVDIIIPRLKTVLKSG